jgi:hypothetical protein
MGPAGSVPVRDGDPGCLPSTGSFPSQCHCCLHLWYVSTPPPNPIQLVSLPWHRPPCSRFHPVAGRPGSMPVIGVPSEQPPLSPAPPALILLVLHHPQPSMSMHCRVRLPNCLLMIPCLCSHIAGSPYDESRLTPQRSPSGMDRSRSRGKRAESGPYVPASGRGTSVPWQSRTCRVAWLLPLGSSAFWVARLGNASLPYPCHVLGTPLDEHGRQYLTDAEPVTGVGWSPTIGLAPHV